MSDHKKDFSVTEQAQRLIEKIKHHKDDLDKLKEENPTAYHGVLHLLHSLKDVLNEVQSQELEGQKNQSLEQEKHKEDDSSDWHSDDDWGKLEDWKIEYDDQDEDEEGDKEDDEEGDEEDDEEDEKYDDKDEDEEEEGKEDDDEDEDDYKYDYDFDEEDTKGAHEDYHDEIYRLSQLLKEHPEYANHVIIHEGKMHELSHLRKPIDHYFEEN